jgi:hypothetical protein
MSKISELDRWSSSDCAGEMFEDEDGEFIYRDDAIEIEKHLLNIIEELKLANKFRGVK